MGMRKVNTLGLKQANKCMMMAVISYDPSNGQMATPVSLEGNPLYGFNVVQDLQAGIVDYTGGLILGLDGNYYGVNALGTGTRLNGFSGKDPGGKGFFYRYVKSTGKIEVLHSFVGKQEWNTNKLIPSNAFNNDLSLPAYTAIETSPGIFYGIATEGGDYGKGGIWKYNLNTQSYSVVGSFDDPSENVGYEPVTALIKGDGDNIYGLNKNKSGSSDDGHLYRINTSNDQLTFVHTLNADGWVMAHPHGQMVYNANLNTIFGTKDQFDASSPWGGGVWSYDITNGVQTNEWTILFSQLSTLGSLATGIVQGNDGFMYVTTRSGGLNGEGTIIKYAPSGGAHVKIFDFPAGFEASGTGMQAFGTKIFGTCMENQSDQMVWSYDYFSGAFQVHLSSTTNDPNHPGWGAEYSLIVENGNIIGRTRLGYRGAGAIFSHNINSNLNTVLVNAASREGRYIIGEMTQLTDSTFVGYVGKGGPNYSTDTNMHYENGSLAVFNMQTGNVQHINDPHVYGTSQEYAQSQWMNKPFLGTNGKVYYSQFASNGFSSSFHVAESDLVNPATAAFYAPAAVGANITSGLLGLSGGRFIMARSNAIYEYDYINDTLLNTYSSTHDIDTYGHMSHNTILASDGKIYGLTEPSELGTSPGQNRGVIYSIDTTTFTFTAEHVFDSLVRNTNNGLTEHNGKLYGSTNFMGDNNQGYLFSYELSSGTFTIEHSFNSAVDGSGFSAGWTLFNNKLYSTSRTGGQNGYGTLVEFDPSNSTLSALEHLTMGNGRSFRGSPIVYLETVGLNTLKNDLAIKIYPNPSEGTFVIEGRLLESVEIFNLNGQSMAFTQYQNTIKMANAKPGVYLVKVISQDGVFGTGRIIVK